MGECDGKNEIENGEIFNDFDDQIEFSLFFGDAEKVFDKKNRKKQNGYMRQIQDRMSVGKGKYLIEWDDMDAIEGGEKNHHGDLSQRVVEVLFIKAIHIEY